MNKRLRTRKRIEKDKAAKALKRSLKQSEVATDKKENENDKSND